ncbi:aldehyde dehydrogenase family protein [Aureimonas glaciei]|nr:aldehyde dehydrogenase family protein [Aureimonas glaciei]
MSTGDPGRSLNPATGAFLGAYVTAGTAEAEDAILAVRRAFEMTAWKSDRALRARVLYQIADAFDAHAEEMAELIAAENGKILPQARMESYSCASTFRYNAALARTRAGRADQRRRAVPDDPPAGGRCRGNRPLGTRRSP